ncbi:MAG: HU family DNA-binding protein [Muribaculaceae bacterium]|nr:HU family DNA-binding protein [Muribaculaceae bacterium]
MSEKITLQGLAQLLALQTGDTRKESDDFLRELFSVIAEALEKDGIVKIKELGVFKTVGVDSRKSVNISTGEDYNIPAHRKIVFTPSKDLAAEINEPFDMFESVELDSPDSLTLDDSDSTEDSADTVDTSSRTEEQVSENNEELNSGIEDSEPEESDSTNENSPNYVTSEEKEDKGIEENFEDTKTGNNPVIITESESTSVTEPYPIAEPADRESISYVDDDALDHDKEIKRHSGNRGFAFGLIAGVLTTIVISGLLVLFVTPVQNWVRAQLNRGQNEVTVENINQADDASIADDADVALEADSVIEKVEDSRIAADRGDEPKVSAQNDDAVPTAPSDKKVYDTISKTRYLTTMAKDHYGNYNLWPYIYMENSAFLGHPDRIKPGTKVVIPSLCKYGVDPNNEADIKKAKQKGVEIYARYK